MKLRFLFLCKNVNLTLGITLYSFRKQLVSNLSSRNFKFVLTAIVLILFSISLISFVSASFRDSCSMDCEPPTIWKTIYGAQLYRGFTIDNQTYTIEKWRQEIPTTTVKVGEPLEIILRMYENYGYRAIKHVALYFDEEKTTSIIWDKKFNSNATITIIDPNEIIESGDVSIIYENDFIVKYNFAVTFEKPVETTTMVAQYWDEFVNSNTNYLLDALKVSE